MDEKPHGVIYKIYFESNPSKAYIGKTTNLKTRKYQHKYCIGKKKSKLYNWLAKYSETEEIKYEVLCECHDADNLDETEIMIIAEHKRNGFILKNMTDGGDGVRKGYRHTDEVKKASSERNIASGKWFGESNYMHGRVGKLNPASIEIHRYSMGGDYIDSFDSMSLALSHIGKKPNHASSICKSMKVRENGANCSRYGYQWRHYKTQDNIGKAHVNNILTEEIIEQCIGHRRDGMSVLKMSELYDYPFRKKLTSVLKERMGEEFYNSKSRLPTRTIMDQNVAVYQYSSEGDYLREFESISAAIEWLRVNCDDKKPSMQRIKKVVAGERKLAHGYQWRDFKTEENIGWRHCSKQNYEECYVKAIEYRLSGKSMSWIASHLKIGRTHISKVLKERMGDEYHNDKTTNRGKRKT